MKFNWAAFLKKQLHIGIANSIPFIGISILELFTEDRIINSYDDLQKNQYFPPKWTFSILRSITLSFISIASYRIWIADSSKKALNKGHAAYFLYSVILIGDWMTIFLSPLYLNLATCYYIALIIIAINTSMVFKQIDRISGFFFIPYILWLTYMIILHYHLYVNNDNGEWFYNYDGSVYATNYSAVDKHVFKKLFGILPKNYTDDE